jgi:predicted dehydrogenase
VKIVTAQIGVGRWGKNLLRNLANLPTCELAYVCDASPVQRALIQAQYPTLRCIDNPEVIFSDASVQAVVIASPAATHVDLAQKALSADQHVFVEKPMALQTSQLAALAKLAQSKKRVLMEGHLLLYHPAVIRLKQAIDDGVIGPLHHLYFRRTNLGAIRVEANVLWDVGPHDFSVLLYLLNGRMPARVSAEGVARFMEKNHETVFTSMAFSDGLLAHFHESWVDPFKDRKIIAVGMEGMLFLDEHATDGKVKLLKKRIHDTHADEDFNRFRYEDEGGELLAIGDEEPLRAELEHFLECVATGRVPRSNAENSLKVLQLLQAAQYSLAHQGSPCSSFAHD